MLHATSVATSNKSLDDWQGGEQIDTELTHPDSTFPMQVFKTDEIDGFVVDVEDVRKAVCKHTLNLENPAVEKVTVWNDEDKEIQGGPEICLNDHQKMSFYFSLKSVENVTYCVPACPAPKFCRDNRCVCPASTPKHALEETCECEKSHIIENNTCVCPFNQIEKNGKCVCPEGLNYWVDGTGCVECTQNRHCQMLEICNLLSYRCECDTASNEIYDGVCVPKCVLPLVRNPQTKGCSCPAGTPIGADTATCQCKSNEVVVNGRCEVKAACSICQTYDAATNTCYGNIPENGADCCAAAGRLWSGSACCAAGQVVVNGTCQDKVTCSVCQVYDATTNTCYGNIPENGAECCAAAGRLWSGSACCAAGQIVVNGTCQDKVACSVCQVYDAATNTCYGNIPENGADCCAAAGRLWSGSACCTSGQVVVNGTCQDKATCTICQTYDAATNTCYGNIPENGAECCAAAGRLWSGSACCTSGQVVVNGECQDKAVCTICQTYEEATNTCYGNIPENGEECCAAAGRLWSGSACCAAGQVVVNSECQDKAVCTTCQAYDAATNTCYGNVPENGAECCTLAGRLWSGSACCATGQVVVNKECQDKAVCTMCHNYFPETNTCSTAIDPDKDDYCCKMASRTWNASDNTCCPYDQPYNSKAGLCCPKAVSSGCNTVYVEASAGVCPYYEDECGPGWTCLNSYMAGTTRCVYPKCPVGKATFANAKKTCANLGGRLPTLKEVTTGRVSCNTLVDSGTTNYCGINNINYYWLAYPGSDRHNRMPYSYSCTNEAGFAYDGYNGAEVHPTTAAQFTCVK